LFKLVTISEEILANIAKYNLISILEISDLHCAIKLSLHLHLVDNLGIISNFFLLLVFTANDPNGVPSHEDVALPSSNNHLTTIPDVTQSPLSHHGRHFVVKSPMAGDRFKSPVVTAMARRQLFDR